MSEMMFDAIFDVPEKKVPKKAIISLDGKNYTTGIQIYYVQPLKKSDRYFGNMKLPKSAEFKWNDPFIIYKSDKKTEIGKGKILAFLPKPSSASEEKKRVHHLSGLLSDEIDMVMTLIELSGIFGISEKEIFSQATISSKKLLKFAQELELEGKIRILSFSPLFFLGQKNFDDLCEKIKKYLVAYHKRYSDKPGVSKEKVLKRFKVHPRIFSLALSSLSRRKAINEMGEILSLANFQWILTPEEKEKLKELEESYNNEGFSKESIEDLQKRFQLSTEKINKLISFLVEKKNVIQTKDGYIYHSFWLEEIIGKIRMLEKTELTVAEFKEITCLSRKYAIPLLELLGQKGIIKRKGAVHKVLSTEK